MIHYQGSLDNQLPDYYDIDGDAQWEQQKAELLDRVDEIEREAISFKSNRNPLVAVAIPIVDMKWLTELACELVPPHPGDDNQASELYNTSEYITFGKKEYVLLSYADSEWLTSQARIAIYAGFTGGE